MFLFTMFCVGTLMADSQSMALDSMAVVDPYWEQARKESIKYLKFRITPYPRPLNITAPAAEINTIPETLVVVNNDNAFDNDLNDLQLSLNTLTHSMANRSERLQQLQEQVKSNN